MISSSTVSNNASGRDGGGIYISFGDLNLASTTITGNQSQQQGGGIAFQPSSSERDLAIQNSIVAGNTDNGTAPDMRRQQQGTVTVGFSLIGDNRGTGIAASSTPDTNGNLIGDAAGSGVIDPLLGPLVDNGGPTLTHVPQPGSPVLERGSDALLVEATINRDLNVDGDLDDTLQNDQRGFTRVVGTVDMGATERQTTETLDGLIVSSSLDLDDGNFSAGELSLREAIRLMNASGSSSAAGGTITFDPGLSGATIAVSEELVIADSLVIDATALAAPVTLDGQLGSRVINFTDGSGSLRLSGLNVVRGRTSQSFQSGAGIRSAGGTLALDRVRLEANKTSGTNAQGAGLFAAGGDVSLMNSTVHNNKTLGGNSRGAGVAVASGNLNIENSTIHNNSTTGGGSDGGGVFSGGTLTVRHSTLSGNAAGAASAGAIFASGSTSIENSTVTLNSASADAGGIVASGSLNHSIVAGNQAGGVADDLSGSFSGNYNLVGAGDSVNGTANQTGVTNPMLAPLASSGGTTLTHAPLPASPAVNAGDPSIVAGQTGVAEFDQRGTGFSRVANGRIDIGAVEYEGLAFRGDVVIQRLASNPAMVEVTVDGTSVITTPVNQLGNLVVAGQAGADNTLTIDYTHGFFGSSGISFVGDAGDSDALRIVGDSPRLTSAVYSTAGQLGTGSLQTSNAGASSTISVSNLSAIDFDSLLSFQSDGHVMIDNGQSLSVDALGFSSLQGTTTLAGGGTLNVPGGVALGWR